MQIYGKGRSREGGKLSFFIYVWWRRNKNQSFSLLRSIHSTLSSLSINIEKAKKILEVVKRPASRQMATPQHTTPLLRAWCLDSTALVLASFSCTTTARKEKKRCYLLSVPWTRGLPKLQFVHHVLSISSTQPAVGIISSAGFLERVFLRPHNHQCITGVLQVLRSTRYRIL